MPDRLEEIVAEFIHRQGLFAGAGGILLAVSGGADSTALLYLLASLQAQRQLDANLVCAHINHQLRGPASDADEQFVLAQAQRLGVPVVAQAVDVRAYGQVHKLSLETAARQLRLAHLAEIAHSHRCTWVGTGHQKNDNAETIVHRLLRGTGFHGLAGIRPVRRLGDLQLASPLLCVTRAEIVRYLQSHTLPWREDQTNADLVYTRNHIRHALLPQLQQEAQGDLVEELSDLAAAATKLHARVEREAGTAWSQLVQSAAGQIILPAPGVAALPELVAVELIRQALVSLGVGESDLTQVHYASILQLARAAVAGKKVSLPHGFRAQRAGERIVLSLAQPTLTGEPAPPVVLTMPGTTQFAGYEIEARILPQDEMSAAQGCMTVGAGPWGAHTPPSRGAKEKGTFSFSQPEEGKGECPLFRRGSAGPGRASKNGQALAAQWQRDRSSFCEYLDLDQVQPPVVVRARQAGDRFQPLGMAKEKKVGKFLTTAKVPHDLREQILVFADREKIVWVCPVRLDERVKIAERTRHVLQLTVRRP